MKNIVFIGLGQMGLPMAINLVKANFHVTGFDNDRSVLVEFQKNGGHVADFANSIKESDAVITMLPNGDVVKEVLLGQEGVINHVVAFKTLVIDMSTISPFETDFIGEAFTKHNIQFMDAPVGRTSKAAREGKLVILAGGTKAQIEKSTPIFKAMGELIIEAGGFGMGSRLKLINNYMSIALNALSAEVINLSEKLGLNYDTVQELFSKTPAGNGHFKTTWPNKVLKGDLSPDFMLALAHKDINLGIAVANIVGVPSPIALAAREMFLMGKNQGREKEDWTAILETYRKASAS